MTAERRSVPRCATCGAPAHPRLLLRPQAERRRPEERVTWLRIAGLVMFVLYLLAVGLYAAPVVLLAVSGVAP